MGGSVSQSNTSGSQNQTQNTQQASNAAPPPWASAALQQAMLTAQSLAQMPFLIQPQPIAPLQPQQKEAFQTVENLQGAYTPFLEAGLGAIGQGAGMQGPAAQYQTPWGASQYFGAESAGVLPQLENIFGQQMAQTTGDLVNRAGGTDAERIAVGQGELANQQGLAAGQTLSQLMGQAVTQGQQAGMNLGQLGMNLGQLGGAAGNLANLGQTMGLQGAQAELNAGTLAQQQLQNAQNAIYANNQQAISWPFQTNAYLSTIASGLTPPAGGNMTQLGSMQGFGQNQSQTKGSSLGGSLGGLAGGLARGGRVAEAAETLRRLLEPDEDEHKHRGHGRQGVKAIARPLGYAEEPRSELDLIPGSSFADGGQVMAPSGRMATPMKGGGSTVSDPVDPQQRIDTLARNQAVNQQLMGVPMGLGLPPGYNFQPNWVYDPQHPERPVPAANPFAGAASAYQTLYPTLPWTPVMPYRNAAFGPPASPTWQPAFESAANIDFRDPRYTQEAEAAGIPVPTSWDLGSGMTQDQLNPWVVTEHTTGAFPTTADASSGALGMLMAERQALTAQLGGMPATPFSFAGPQTASGVPGAAMLPPAQQGAAPGRAHGGRVPMQGGGAPAPAPAAAATAPTAPSSAAPVAPPPGVFGPTQDFYGVPPPGTVFLGTPIAGTTPGTALPWTQGASYPNLRAPGTVPGAASAAPPATPPAAPATMASAAAPSSANMQPSLVQGVGSPGAPAPQGVPIGALTMPSLGVLPTRGQGQQANALLGRARGGRIPMQGGGISAPTSTFGGGPMFTFPGYGSQPGAVFFDPQNQVVPNTGGLWPYQGQIAGPTQQAAPTFGVNNFSGMGKGGGWGGGGWGGGGSPWTANQNPVNQQAVWPPPAAPMPTSGSMSMPWSGNMGKGFRTGGRIPMQGGGDPAQTPSPGIANPAAKGPLQVGSLTMGPVNPAGGPPVNPADPAPSAQSDPLGGIIAKPNLPPGKPLTSSLGPPPFQQMAQAKPSQGKGGEGGGGGGGKPPKMPKPPGQGQGRGQGQGQGQGQGPAQPAPQAQPPADAQTDTGAPTGPTDPATGVPLNDTSNALVPQVKVATPQTDTPENQFAAMTGGRGPFDSGGGGPFDVTSSGDMGGFGNVGDMSGQDVAAADTGSQDVAVADTGGGGGGKGMMAHRGGVFQTGGYATDSGYPSSSAPVSSTSSTLETPWNAYFLRGATDQAYSGEWNQPASDDSQLASQLAQRGGAIGRSLAIARRGMDDGGDPGAGGDVGGGDYDPAGDSGRDPTPVPLPDMPDMPIQDWFDRQFHDYTTDRKPDAGPTGPGAIALGTREPPAPLAGRPGALTPIAPPQSPAPAPAPVSQAGTNPLAPSLADQFLPTPASRAIRVAQQPSGPAGVSRETVPGYGGDAFSSRPEEQAVSYANAKIAEAAGLPRSRPPSAPGWPGQQTKWLPQGWLQGPYQAGNVPLPQGRPFGAPGVVPPLPSPRPEGAPGEVPLPQARPLMFNERFAGMGMPAAPMGAPIRGVPSSGVLTPQARPATFNARFAGTETPFASTTWLPPHGGGIPQDILPPVAGTASAAERAVTTANRPPALPAPIEPTIGQLAQQNAAALKAAGIDLTDVPEPGLKASAWAQKYPQYAGHPQIQGPLNQAIAAHQAAVQRYQQQQQAQPRYPPQPLPAGQARPPVTVPDASEPASAVRNIQVPTVPSNGVIPGGINRTQPYGNQVSVADQIRRNPALVSRMAEMVRGEVGGQGAGHPGLQRKLDIMELETALNRAQVRGISLDQALLSIAQSPAHGYYASNTYRGAPSATEVAAFRENVLKPVMAGSDLTGQFLGKPGTGNASQMAFAGQRLQQGVYERGHWASGRPGVGEMFVVERGDAPQVAALPRHPMRDPWANPVSIGDYQRGGYADGRDVPAEDTAPPDDQRSYKVAAADNVVPGAEAPAQQTKTITTVPVSGAATPTTRLPGPGEETVEQPAVKPPPPPQPEQRPPTKPAATPVQAQPAPARQPARPEDRFAFPEGGGMNPIRAWLMSALSGDPEAALKWIQRRNEALSGAWRTNYERMKDISDEQYPTGSVEDIGTTIRNNNKEYHDILKKTPSATAAGAAAAAPGTAGAAAAEPVTGAGPGQPGGVAAVAAAPAPPMTQQQAVQQQISAMEMSPIEQEMFNRAYRHLGIPRAGGAEELTQLMDHRVARIQHEAETGLIAANTAQVAVRTAREGWLPLGPNGENGYLNVNPYLTNPRTGQPVPATDPSRYLSPLLFRRMMIDSLRSPGATTAEPSIGGAPGQPQPPATLLSPTPLTAPLQGGAGPLPLPPAPVPRPLPTGSEPQSPPKYPALSATLDQLKPRDPEGSAKVLANPAFNPPVAVPSIEAMTSDPRRYYDFRGREIAQSQSKLKIEAAEKQFEADSAKSPVIESLLQQMERLHTSPALEPGALFHQRLELAGSVNQLAKTFGFEPPIDEKDVAQVENVNQLSAQLVLGMARGMGGRASGVINRIAAAMPGPENSRDAMIFGLNLLKQFIKRNNDYKGLLDQWTNNSPNASVLGFDKFIERSLDDELYVRRAQAASLADGPLHPEAIAYLQAHPEKLKAWERNLGPQAEGLGSYILQHTSRQ